VNFLMYAGSVADQELRMRVDAIPCHSERVTAKEIQSMRWEIVVAVAMRMRTTMVCAMTVIYV
jgi:hypothetical protein